MSAGTHSTSITTMLFLSIDSLNYEGVLTNVTNIVLRTTAVYIVVLAGLRLLGKHHVAQLSIIDLVLILLIAMLCRMQMRSLK
jgi:hypothetical protein